jgi:hypothetical protein
MTANVSVQTARREALLLPAAAVRQEGEQSFVYVPGSTGPGRKPVVVGTKENGMVEIKRGISAVDEVLLIPSNGTSATGSVQSPQ